MSHILAVEPTRLEEGDVRHADAQEPAVAARPGAIQGGLTRRAHQAAAAARRRQTARQTPCLHAGRQEVAYCKYLFILL
jgi:hypothetical protein